MTDDMANTSAIERVARVLAAGDASINTDGDRTSASRSVDEIRRSYQDKAVAVLKALREPDDAIAAVGDGELWTRMVEAALGVAFGGMRTGRDPSKPLEIGSDPMIEGP